MTRDGLPWCLSVDNPTVRASLNAWRSVHDAFDAEFRTALVAAVERTPGIYGRVDTDVPYVFGLDDPRGQYPVSCGIAHFQNRQVDQMSTYLNIRYSRAAEDSKSWEVERVTVLDLGYFFDESSRDTKMLAALAVAAIVEHRRQQKEGTAT